MASQTIVWIAIPQGIPKRNADARARLSVFVVPQLQLDEAGTLAPFDFLNWPARVTPDKLQFEVAFDGATAPATIVSTPDADLWAALFTERTLVRPHAPDALSPVYGSYPAARIHEHVKAGYQNVLVNSTLEHASRPGVASAFPELAQAFGPPPGDLDLAPTTSDRERRTAIARRFFHSGVKEGVDARADQLVQLARDEAQRTLSVDALPEFIPIVPDDAGVVTDFAQLALFHRQRGGTTSTLNLAPADRERDFHQWVSALGNYPGLLKRLGLVLELEIDQALIPETAAGAHRLLRIVPRFLNPLAVQTASRTPATAYEFARRRRFASALERAGGRPPESVSGLLNLRGGSPDAEFQIVQVDVDGAGLRTLDLMARATESPAPNRAPHDDAEDLALPPLRTTGLSIVHHGTARFLHDAIRNGSRKLASIAGGGTETLFAEDLIRGYRVDVRRTARGKWLSLHARKGTYGFPARRREETIVDEDVIQPSLVKPIADAPGLAPSRHDPDAPNYISESLFLWQGWSQAVPRPGESLAEPPSAPSAGAEPPVPSSTLDLETVFEVPPSSLPRLRFGQRYHLRARTADLSGGGLSPDEADAALDALGPAETVVLPALAEEGFPFLRFEPVAAPVVIPRSTPVDGESLERIVLRSTPDQTADDFTARHPKYLHAAERHIVPPKIAQLMAEMYGAFDVSMGTGLNLQQTYELALRETASLGDAQGNAVDPGATLGVPYLPDPSAGGVTFRNLPGVPPLTMGRAGDAGLEFSSLPLPARTSEEVGSLVLVDFGPASAWPDAKPFRLRLVEGNTRPEWNAAERVLTVALHKGDVRTVRMSCHIRDAAALRLFGIDDWMTDWLRKQEALGVISSADAPARRTELEQLSLLGLPWMLTPYREVTLVHAVQQPLEAPSNLIMRPIKYVGRTYVNVRGTVHVHGASTGRVELRAHWTEPIETGEPRPRRQQFNAPVFASPLLLSQQAEAQHVPADAALTPAATFDPARNTVTYLGPAIETFDAALKGLADELSRATRDLVDAARRLSPPRPLLLKSVRTLRDNEVSTVVGILHSSPLLLRWPEVINPARSVVSIANAAADPQDNEPPALDEGPLPFEIPELYRDIASTAEKIVSTAQAAIKGRFEGRHEFGDTKHRSVTYEAVATTRFADCFDADDKQMELSRVSPGFTVDILSSESPPPPNVGYVVPAFPWIRSSDGTDRHSRRRGGALRIYLERPWFSSGEGELLGIVLGSHPDVGGMITRWGRDTIWLSPKTVSDLLTADAILNSVALPEAAPADVALFEVAFDDDGRCFCDVEIDPGDSYFPFIRLALIRYQPKSVPGVERSAAVYADFIQVAPERTVTVTSRAAHTFDVTVAGGARTETDLSLPGPHKNTRVSVSLQERIRGSTDDAGWVFSGDGSGIVPATDVPAGRVLWRGSVTLPEGRTPGQFRLRIEEMETHERPEPGGGPMVSRLVDRVVFVETMEL